MARHLSLETVIDKNRISSTVVYLTLARIEIIDEDTGQIAEIIRLARNDETVTYKGEVYDKAWFEFSTEETADGVPSISVSVQDPTGAVMAKADQHDGGVGWRIRFMVVSSARLNEDAEIEELVFVKSSKAKDYGIDLTLGARNPLTQKFPARTQWRDKCPWAFKGAICGYTGTAKTCDYSLGGENGCAAKGNSERFGGFPGIRAR